MPQKIEPEPVTTQLTQIAEPLPLPRGARDKYLTKEFLLGCLRKSLESNFLSEARLQAPPEPSDEGDKEHEITAAIVADIIGLAPSRLSCAASVWGQRDLWNPDAQWSEVRPINKWVEDAVNALQDAAADAGLYLMLEFAFAEIVREDGLQWAIPREIVGSSRHWQELDDFDPENPRNWSFDNIYHPNINFLGRPVKDVWLIRKKHDDGTEEVIASGVPYLGRPEAFWRTLAIFDIFYNLGFRSFHFQNLQMQTWGDPDATGLVQKLVTMMRNYALFGSAFPEQTSRQNGDPIIIGVGERHGMAVPSDNPFCTDYSPLFDFALNSLFVDISGLPEQWDQDGDPQRNFQPFLRCDMAPDWRYPVNNPYRLPMVFVLDNASCYDPITWFAMLHKDRRDKNLGLVAFELAAVSEQCYLSIPYAIGYGNCFQFGYCYGGRDYTCRVDDREMPVHAGDQSCRLNRDEAGNPPPFEERYPFYALRKGGQIEAAKKVYQWTDDISNRPVGYPQCVFWVLDQQMGGVLLKGSCQHIASAEGWEPLKAALSGWGPTAGCYVDGCNWLVLIRHGQVWWFDADNLSNLGSVSSEHLLVGCPPSYEEAGWWDLTGKIGATEPGLKQNVYAWERRGPDNVVYLPPGLKITVEKYGVLVAKDGNLWLKRGGCWEACCKMQHLLENEIQGVQKVDEMHSWAGRGPDTMTAIPNGLGDNGRDLLVIRAGRYWLYRFLPCPDDPAYTFQLQFPYLELLGQGLLEDLMLSGFFPGASRESLCITKHDTGPDLGGPDFEIHPWSGPLFGGSDEWQIRSGPNVIIYFPRQGRFLIIKGTRLLNTWQHQREV